MIEVELSGAVGGFRLEASFSVPAEGVTAISGPSGSGKTTLLRCIAGLTRLKARVAVAGEVWQDGRRFTPTHARRVGYVFQEPSLLPHLSVRGNLDYGLRRARGGAGVSFDEAVALLGLEPLLGRSPARLSGGERQRVAIGRALVARPALLLMDEPVSSLDAESKAEVLPALERLHRSLSLPVLYVSHDPAEVARLADRVLIMRAGRIEPAPPPPATSGLEGLSEDEIRRLAQAALTAGF